MNGKQIKNSKPFSLWDTAVYLSVAFLIFLLFLFFIIIPKANANESKGFIVTSSGKVIVTHHYGSKNFNIDKNFTHLVDVTETADGYYLTIYNDLEKIHFNKLFVNTEKKTVKMDSSDCRSKQCVYLHEIGSDGVIYCAPRSLKISPLGSNGFIPPVAG